MWASAAMRRTVRPDTPLSAAISFQVCPARRSTLYLVSLEHLDHPFLAGDGISDDVLAR